MTAPDDGLHAAGILFDLDGVLVDSGSTVDRSWQGWARRHGLDPALVLASCHGRPTAETIAALAPHLDPAAEAVTLEKEQAEDTADLRPCPGAAALLAQLPGDRWAVVTSGSRALAVSRLGHVGLPVPAVLVTADDVTRGKPDPEGYRAGARGLGLDPRDCVVIEDASSGVRAARAAGCRVVGVRGPVLGPTSDLDALVENLAGLAVTPAASGLVLHLREAVDG
ncbi:HAD-IA family hydrolase [Micromonospora coxensis]|uniref:HAD-IA family hydrolase n=1 Tax=Micromonospora coxensis TaxID=356852 RepID=UPI0034480722